MKLPSSSTVKELIGQEPLPKHLAFFLEKEANFSYPEVWYRLWISGLANYLDTRERRQRK
jgi:hypothetical protein